MKSDLHKVLHPIAGRPMLLHLLDTRRPRWRRRGRWWWSARGREQVEAAVAPLGVDDRRIRPSSSAPAMRSRRREAALGGFAGDVLILYGDVPLVSAGDDARGWSTRLHGDDAPAAVGARLPPGRSRRLWPGHRRRRRADRPDGRVQGRDRRRTRGNAVQFGADGGARRGSVRAARARRQRQCGGRILPARHRHARGRRRARVGGDRDRRGRGRRRQQPRRTRRGRGARGRQRAARRRWPTARRWSRPRRCGSRTTRSSAAT